MAVVTILDKQTQKLEAGEFIAEGQMVYIGNDGKAYNVDPNAPKSELEAQERRMQWVRAFEFAENADKLEITSKWQRPDIVEIRLIHYAKIALVVSEEMPIEDFASTDATKRAVIAKRLSEQLQALINGGYDR